ncbi:MAG: Rrf2 family transcriptional regulator [Fimbriimonadaceae bacterium]|nr:Rrf2 family transcriptional regulator [Fimbriimonadaceae bacterium]
MLSQTAEYALRAVVCLAAAHPARLTTPQIARTTKVPAGYLAKVLQSLARASVVKSHRGLGGGFVLARPTNEISVLQVINAVDPLQRIKSCPLELGAHGVKLCPLHKRLDDAMATVEAAFAGTTIAEVLADPEAATAFCEFPQIALTPLPAPAPADAP